MVKALNLRDRCLKILQGEKGCNTDILFRYGDGMASQDRGGGQSSAGRGAGGSGGGFTGGGEAGTYFLFFSVVIFVSSSRVRSWLLV
jgi:hypothetical protein